MKDTIKAEPHQCGYCGGAMGGHATNCISSLSQQAKRIAIAEACGWTVHENYGSAGGVVLYNQHGLITEGLWCSKEHALAAGTPDYLNDLNAMHEAEAVIHDSGKWNTYYEFIYQRLGSKGALHATAATRADAFLVTIGSLVRQ
jgi:hypothetical protein